MNTTHHHSTDTTHNAGGSSRTLQAPPASNGVDGTFELRVARAIDAINTGSDGCAVIGPSVAVARAVSARGYAVVLSKNLHGNSTYKGFTAAALCCSEYGCIQTATGTILVC